MNYKQNTKGGFTIIEVVLVLAIAGLIFLIVFLAVPALQRSQRDTQRRNDASRALTALSNYKSNNRGTLPTTAAAQTSYATSYLRTATEFNSPTTGAAYTLNWSTAAAAPTQSATVDTVQIAIGRICNGELLAAGGGRNVAVRVTLEGGGVFCTSE